MKKLNIENYITHVNNMEDQQYLKKVLPNVNIRLLKSSPPYKLIVQRACEYIKWLCATTMDGYKKPHGMSGANAGIPWNIICITRNRGKRDEYQQVMINPHIIDDNDELIETTTNCGSIRLKEPIKVKRIARIHVVYHDENGEEKDQWFNPNNGSFTIQHEIDHNQGILITNRISLEERKAIEKRN